MHTEGRRGKQRVNSGSRVMDRARPFWDKLCFGVSARQWQTLAVPFPPPRVSLSQLKLEG